MKKVILILCLFCCFSNRSNAQKIEIDQKSLSEYTLAKLKSLPENPQLISWGQGWLDSANLSDTFFSELENFETSAVITKADRNYIIDVVEKFLNKATIDQKEKLQTIACKWLALSSETNQPSWRCEKKNYNLQLLKDKLPKFDFLVAEDMGIQLGSQFSISVIEKAIYNWNILSNINKSISFRGTFQDLLNQNFIVESLIQGDCDSFTHSIDDLEVISRGSVYFSPECRKNLNQPETSNIKQWYERNKSWVIPVGIAMLAATVYQLKDKKIIINKPK